MLYFIRALRQIRFLLRQRNNNVNKQLENSIYIYIYIIIFLHFTIQKKIKVASDLRHKEGQIKLLFATEAYGMGADSPDIRRIVHVGPPNSLESKYLFQIQKSLIIKL